MSDPNGDGQLSVVLFSGTDDKLTAASILVAGAAALGRRVDILLQYWGLEAFRRGRVQQDHGLSVADDAEGASLVAGAEAPPSNNWSETLRQAKDIGEVRVHACAHSMELFHLGEGDLGVKLVPCQMTMDLLGLKREDMIDGLGEPVGATTMLMEAQNAITLFI